MQHEETNIGVAAFKGLKRYFEEDEKLTQLVEVYQIQLSNLLQHRSTVVQMRVLDLLIDLACQTTTSRVLIEKSGRRSSFCIL